MAGGFGIQEGFIFGTDDGGATWDVSSCFDLSSTPTQGDCTPPSFYGAAMPGGDAVVVGYGSQTMVFEPGAANFEVCACAPSTACTAAGSVWVECYDPDAVAPVLRGVEAVDSSEVVIVGEFGILRRLDLTTGAFEDQGAQHFLRLRAGALTGSDTGCVIGQANVILRWTSSGDDWTQVYAPVVPDYGTFGRDIAFSTSGQKGVAVGDGFAAWSADAGLTWSPPVTPPSSNPQLSAVAFVPGSDVVYALSSTGPVRKSYDGGVNWSPLAVHLPTAETLLGLSFVSDTTGYVVGTNQTVFSTSNGGTTWTPVTVHGGIPGEDFYAVATWGDGTPAIAVGTDGLIYEKTGTRFEKVNLGTSSVTQNLRDVQVLVSGAGEHVRICGLGGVALFRDNGVWSKPKSQTSDDLVALSFLSPDEGYAVGSKALLVKYE